MKITKLFGFLILSLLLSINASAQEISESDLGFDGELIITDDLSCLDSFNKKSSIKRKRIGKTFKSFTYGKNLRGNSLIYFGEGIASIDAQPQDTDYVDAIQNAIAIAGLRAKRELALFRAAETTQTTIDRAMEAFAAGIPVSDYAEAKDDLNERENDYTETGIAKKFYLFINKKLDDWIGEKASINDSRSELEKELKNVVSQSVFKEIITTLAYSEIAGMKNVQIQVNKQNVCVLSVWTERTNRWANELGNLNYRALSNLRPGNTTHESQIPSKDSQQGLKTLTASYGLQIDIDKNGEIYFISYAQAGSLDRSSDSINNARMIANNRARGQIAQFQNEAVDVYQNLENSSIKTTYIDEISNKYNERNFMSRTKSSATLNIAGVEQFDWWATIHPFTKKPVVGVVLVWRPSSAIALEKSAENEEYDDLAF